MERAFVSRVLYFFFTVAWIVGVIVGCVRALDDELELSPPRCFFLRR